MVTPTVAPVAAVTSHCAACHRPSAQTARFGGVCTRCHKLRRFPRPDFVREIENVYLRIERAGR